MAEHEKTTGIDQGYGTEGRMVWESNELLNDILRRTKFPNLHIN